MKYLALLRGINVGGNNIIKMSDLKFSFEKLGFANINTYIQSGNIIFDSEKKDIEKISELIESGLSKDFAYDAKVVIVSQVQLKHVVEHIPREWTGHTNIRCYIAFLRPPLTSEDALSEIELKDGVDFVRGGNGVLYMTTVLAGLTKSKFNKILGKEVYKHMTIRNLNTTEKLYEIMTKTI